MQRTFINAQCANGSQVEVKGSLILPVTFKNITKNIEFLVIPTIEKPFILGMDFVMSFQLLNLFELENTNEKLDTTSHKTLDNSEIATLVSKNDLSSQQLARVDKVINKFKSISSDQQGLGKTHLISHKINTTGSPIKQRYYPLSPAKSKALNEEVDKMLSLGVIAPSQSPWSNPVVMIPKKDGSWRFCLDARKLNDVTVKDSYPLPYISSILDNLKGTRYLTSIDLSSAYWQIPLCDDDDDGNCGTSCQKTAFVVPNRGLFEFKRMPFGLSNAGSELQRLIDSLFRHQYGDKIFGYIDDLLIATNSFDEHLELLNIVFRALKEAGLTVNLDKCEFCKGELQYLGYVINNKGLQTDPKKLECIAKFPRPSTARQLRGFIGLCSYYRRFVQNFSTIIAPLTKLIGKRKGKDAIDWTSEADQAFIELKKALTSAPVLACPDFKKPFTLHTDASSVGIGSVLTQDIEGVEHPVAFHSRLLSKTERNYSTTERELLAVLDSIYHFRAYLEGSKFSVVTDHMSLKWLKTLNNPSGRLARWAMQLSCFNFEVCHRQGKLNVVPDALSRVSINLITYSGGTHGCSDPWYNKVFNGCKEKPQFYKNFIIKDNILYRSCKNKFNLQSQNLWKVVMPRDLVESCIKECHDGLGSVHPGTLKTLFKVKELYFWKGMFQDIKNYVSSCEICKAHKISNSPPHGLMKNQKEVSKPMHTLSLDIIGPFPKAHSGHVYILSIVDIFSKYIWLHPLRTATTKTVTSYFESEIILKQGTPCTIICDNATIFKSREFQNFCNKYSIPKIFYTAHYAPQSNTVERYNQTVNICLSILVEQDQRSWSSHLPKIQLFLNSTVNLATGFTPYFLFTGRDIVIDGKTHTIQGSLPNSVEDLTIGSRDEAASSLSELVDIFQKVQEALTIAYNRNAKRYNTRRINLILNEGDTVWRRNFVQSDAAKFFSAKLAPKFVKCIVKKRISNIIYELRDFDTTKVGKYHIKDIIKV